jgi:hypothetical protein
VSNPQILIHIQLTNATRKTPLKKEWGLRNWEEIEYKNTSKSLKNVSSERRFPLKKGLIEIK